MNWVSHSIDVVLVKKLSSDVEDTSPRCTFVAAKITWLARIDMLSTVVVASDHFTYWLVNAEPDTQIASSGKMSSGESRSMVVSLSCVPAVFVHTTDQITRIMLTPGRHHTANHPRLDSWLSQMLRISATVPAIKAKRLVFSLQAGSYSEWCWSTSSLN